jgi:integrase
LAEIANFGKRADMANINKDKTSIKYWEGKVAKRKQKDAKGNESVAPYFSVNFKHANKGTYVCLQTDNKYVAAQKARDAYVLLKAKGWEAMWAIYKVRKSKEETWNQNKQSFEVHQNDENQNNLTIGDFIKKIKENSFLKAATLHEYELSLYQIAADIFDIKSGTEKYDYVNRGNLVRINKIHSIKLAELTPELIEKWKSEQLKIRSKNNQHLKNSAMATINSITRNAKSLFSKEMLKLTNLSTVLKSPFSDISLFKEGSHRYISKFDAKELIENAQKELKPISQNAYAIFLLALGCGLRRNEIDKLLWEQVDLEDGTISIYATKFFTPKTRESSSEVPIAPFVADELRGMKIVADDIFVIPSKIGSRLNAQYTHYRCNGEYRKIYEWLKAQGIDNKSPLHTLRKEYGSQICRDYGLYMASRALRHSSYKITEEYYVDKTARVTPSFLEK